MKLASTLDAGIERQIQPQGEEDHVPYGMLFTQTMRNVGVDVFA